MTRPAGIHLRDARAPDGMVLYAIGDVHGRLDLLTRMHAAIAADRDRRRAADWRVIHLGDYVDRGPESRGVIDFLIDAVARDPRHLALAGNHDLGMLDFLAAPRAEGLFALYGGVQTAASYGVALDLSDTVRLAAAHRAFAAAVPRRHEAFLRGLALSAGFGDFFFCHAGIRPGVALDAQQRDDLIWIRDPFHRHAALHPKVVVHGHTPVAEVELLDNRVNVDTGAFMSGRLSALVVDGVEKSVIRVG